MGCVILGKSLDLSGLRLLICVIRMASPASCFSVCSFVQQVPTDIHHLPDSALGAEDTAEKLMVSTFEGIQRQI